MQGVQKNHRITATRHANKEFFTLWKSLHGGFQSD